MKLTEVLSLNAGRHSGIRRLGMLPMQMKKMKMKKKKKKKKKMIWTLVHLLMMTARLNMRNIFFHVLIYWMMDSFVSRVNKI
jgi:hypothetical protein